MFQSNLSKENSGSNYVKEMSQSNSEKKNEESNSSREIFEELIRILLTFADKINNNILKFDTKEIKRLYLTNKFSKLKLDNEKEISFETEKLYIYISLRKHMII